MQEQNHNAITVPIPSIQTPLPNTSDMPAVPINQPPHIDDEEIANAYTYVHQGAQNYIQTILADDRWRAQCWQELAIARSQFAQDYQNTTNETQAAKAQLDIDKNKYAANMRQMQENLAKLALEQQRLAAIADEYAARDKKLESCEQLCRKQANSLTEKEIAYTELAKKLEQIEAKCGILSSDLASEQDRTDQLEKANAKLRAEKQAIIEDCDKKLQCMKKSASELADQVNQVMLQARQIAITNT